MRYNIIWSNFAENELDKIFEYYSDQAGSSVAKKLIQKIIAASNKLIKNPEISPVEELLINKAEKYRFLIYKNYKIIYSVDHENRLIKIADVFDTRQNPVKIDRTK